MTRGGGSSQNVGGVVVRTYRALIQEDRGSNPLAAVSKLGLFSSALLQFNKL